LALPDYIAKRIFFSNNLLGRYIARKTFFSPSTSKEIVNEYLDGHIESMENYSPKTFKCFKCLFGFNSAGWLHSLTMPALVVIGKDDKIIPIVEAEKLHQLLPYSRLVKLNSGHLPMYEDYIGLNRAIKEFLDYKK
jgi:pimeloyl-ACP methyl ester carboxylesterase